MARALHLQPRRGFADLGLRLACSLRDHAIAELDTMQPPSHLLQECRALRRGERCRELAQERHLLVGQVKPWRTLSSVRDCTFEPRAKARVHLLQLLARPFRRPSSSPGARMKRFALVRGGPADSGDDGLGLLVLCGSARRCRKRVC